MRETPRSRGGRPPARAKARSWTWTGIGVWALAALGCAAPESATPSAIDPVPVGIPAPVPPVAAVVIEGQPSYAIHDHGGPPASLSTARFAVRNNLASAGRIEVDEIEYLRGSSCDEQPPRDVASRPQVKGLSVGDGAPATSVTVPAGAEVELAVYFSPVEAATTSCDRFWFRVHFLVAGTPRISLAETHVEREASGPDL